jgi:hypothetical protein
MYLEPPAVLAPTPDAKSAWSTSSRQPSRAQLLSFNNSGEHSMTFIDLCYICAYRAEVAYLEAGISRRALKQIEFDLGISA